MRESVYAYFIGPGPFLDAFVIAFRIPNLSRRMFGEGAFSAAFIPVLSEKIAQEDEEGARRLTGNALLTLAAVLIGLLLLGWLIIGLVSLYHSTLTQNLTALMLPYMVFICLVALLAGAQNVLGKFATPALMPIVFNVILISGVLLGNRLSRGSAQGQIYFLASMVVAGGAIQLVWQYLSLRRGGFRPQWVWQPRDPDLRRIAVSMTPMMLGLAAIQINTLMDQVIVSIFVEKAGAVSALNFAERLYELPLGLFGVAIATAIFPQLSRQAEQPLLFENTLLRGLRLAFYLGIPASVGLWAVRTPLVQILFEHGAFGPDDTRAVAAVTGWFGVGVWAFISQQIIIRAYYARQDTRTPMRVALFNVGLNLAMNLVFVQFWQASGVAVATSICAAIQFYRLTALAPVKIGIAPLGKALWSFAVRVIAAAGGMLLVVLLLDYLTQGWDHGTTVRACRLMLMVAGGGGVFGCLTLLLGCDELHLLSRWRAIRGK
ncbi:MAG: putative lipid II flippase MurJ [Phycisphaerae bacterium]|nr:putative lipid II flippase MurJ [Phycisphaerae bacterium]